MNGRVVNLKGRPLFLVGIATLLILVGLSVIASWHLPSLFAPIYPYTTLMAYNTAIGFIACGVGLLAINNNQWHKVFISILLLWVIGIVTLIDLLTDLNLHTTDWFVFLLHEPPLRNQPISPTTSSMFLLAGAALAFGYIKRGNAALLATLICLLIILIATAAVMGQSFGLLPNFVWLGIKMAPHTVVGLITFALAIIVLRYTAAINAFNRLTVFHRLVTGFIFMSLLFVGIGSIAVLQINSVAAISQQLYSGPLQISNALLRIKSRTSKLNRTAKDIAVAPELAQKRNLPVYIAETETSITKELTFIAQQAPYAAAAEQLQKAFNQWQVLLATMHHQLQAGDIDGYRHLALEDSQDIVQTLEKICDLTIDRAQNEIRRLNDQALITKHHAGNLMMVVILGFLVVGIMVAALITRSLSWQLQKIRTAMLALAQGNTQVDIPFLDHPRDVGDMAKTLKVFAQNIDERNKSAVLLAQHQRILEKTNLQLAQTNKELETFAYVASHDLKSPLRGIAQLSTWIEEDLEEQQFAEVNKHTVMLRNRIQRMEKLLDDLLAFYRAGKTDGNLVQVDVAHMAKELFDIQNTKPGLHLELAENLPNFTTLSTPFEQVLRNLFSNAIKHHDREQGMIRLSCTTLPNQFYRFSVCDDGPGIPEKFQQRVFGMFQTLKPRDELEGSGMGLALIRKIVDTYGGTITLESEGRGCCFHFSWPQHITKDQKDD